MRINTLKDEFLRFIEFFDISNFNINFFTDVGDLCLTIDGDKAKLVLDDNILLVQSKNTNGRSIIDLNKIVMVEFVEK